MVDCRQTRTACSGVAGDGAQADTIFSFPPAACVALLSKQPDASALRKGNLYLDIKSLVGVFFL